MQSEMIFKLLQQIGIKKETIDLLKKEELPEEFDLKSVVSSYQSDRKELFLQNNKQSIIDKYLDENRDKTHLKTVMPFYNRLKKMNVWEENEIDDEEIKKNPSLVKEMLDKLPKRIEAKIATGADEGVKQLREKITDLDAKYKKMLDEKDGRITHLNESLETEKTTAEKKYNSFVVNQKLDSLLMDKELVDLQYDGKFPIYSRVLKEELLKRYTFNPEDLSIKGLEGERAQSINGESFYDDPKTAIKEVAAHLNLLPKSNAGQGSGDGNPIPNEEIVNGKNVDRSISAALAKEWATG